MTEITAKKQSTALLILAFFAIYIIWGTTYLAVLFGLEGFPPFILSAFRFTIAGLIVITYSIIKKEKFPAGNDMTIAIVSGIVMLVGGSGLIAWAEQYIPSGQAAIVIATEPFMFLLLDKKRWPFYFSQLSIIIGLILGFTGIVIFFLFMDNQVKGTAPEHLRTAGLIVLFSSGILWVVGSLYSKTKKDQTVSNTATTAIQLISAGVFSGILAFATGEHKHFELAAANARSWWGLIYLIIGGSVISFLAFTWLIKVRPPAQVSTHTYVNPVIAVIAGWLFAHESLSLIQVIGLVIILAGVLLANRKAGSE
jgi:drug/metabolite transporter (DMT)-like permease